MDKFNKINKLYNKFINLLTVIFLILIILAFLNPNYFPKEAAISSMIVVFIGIIGFWIDKINWRKTNINN